MCIDELIFVGLRSQVIALHRDTGEIVWNCSLRYSGLPPLLSKFIAGPISLLLDGDRLIASTNGYIYCLDPMTGQMLWNNPLRGYGVDIAHLVSVRGQSSQTANQQAIAKAKSTAFFAS